MREDRLSINNPSINSNLVVNTNQIQWQKIDLNDINNHKNVY